MTYSSYKKKKKKINDIFEMLYLVGLGLADETDITVKGLEIVKKAERVYLEAYTSILLVSKDKLVSGFYSFVGKTIPFSDYPRFHG